MHDQGLCESDDIGTGTRIWAFAHVLAGAHVGARCNIGDHAFVEGGAVIGDDVTIKNGVMVWSGVTIEDGGFVGPGTVFTNDRTPRALSKKNPNDLLRTTVQRDATIGANVTVLCGITIGHHALIGAGSVVTSDVKPHALMVGSPARCHGWACACGETLDESLGCSCGRVYAETEGRLTEQS